MISFNNDNILDGKSIDKLSVFITGKPIFDVRKLKKCTRT